MISGQPDTAQHTGWQVSRRDTLVWRCWEGEVVIYDNLSGDTMKLDIIMSAIFQFMLPAPASDAQIERHLASMLALSEDAQLHRLTALALRRLREADLIEAA